MSNELKAVVDKFLCWKLPQHFAPDCGISFDGRKDDEWNKNKTWPTGTNLFTAEQAEAMLREIGIAALLEENARLKRHAEYDFRDKVERVCAKVAQSRIPFQPTEHGYEHYQLGVAAVRTALLSGLNDESNAPELFKGTTAALNALGTKEEPR